MSKPLPVSRYDKGCTRGQWAEPFLVLLRGTKGGALQNTAFSIDTPLPTITAGGGHIGLVEPFLVPNFSERAGQRPRTHAIDEPMPTVTGHGAGALVSPFIIPQQSGGAPRSVDDPVPTIATDGAHALVRPFLTTVAHGTPAVGEADCAGGDCVRIAGE